MTVVIRNLREAERGGGACCGSALPPQRWHVGTFRHRTEFSPGLMVPGNHYSRVQLRQKSPRGFTKRFRGSCVWVRHHDEQHAREDSQDVGKRPRAFVKQGQGNG